MISARAEGFRTDGGDVFCYVIENKVGRLVGFAPWIRPIGLQVIENTLPRLPQMPTLPGRITRYYPTELLRPAQPVSKRTVVRRCFPP